MNPQTPTDAGTEPEATPAASADQASTNGSASNKPLWSDVSDSKRVHVAVWRHDQGHGERRYTTSISRRYFSEREGKYVNSSFFDHPQDLQDVLTFTVEAMRKIDRFKGEGGPA